MPGSTSRPNAIEAADGAMLTVAVLWASNNVVAKAALDGGLEPLIYVVLRLALVAGLLFPYLWLRGKSLRVRRSDVPRFAVSGLFGFGLYTLLYTVGLAHTTAFSTAILMALAPIFILIISAALGLERVRHLQWAGVLLSFLGVAFFVGDKLLAGQPALGDLLSLAAALSFAGYALLTRPLVQRYGPETTTAWAVLIGLGGVLPFTFSEMRSERLSALDGLAWFAIAYAALISVMLGYSLWGWAITRSGAGRSVPYLFLIPVFTGIFAVIFRDDRLGASQLIGGALVLAGIALARIVARPGKERSVRLPSTESEGVSDVDRRPRAVPGP